MNIKYDGEHVTGSAGTTGDKMTEEQKRAEMKPVSANVPLGTVDQRIDWAAMLGSRLQIGEKLTSLFTILAPV